MFVLLFLLKSCPSDHLHLPTGRAMGFRWRWPRALSNMRGSTLPCELRERGAFLPHRRSLSTGRADTGFSAPTLILCLYSFCRRLGIHSEFISGHLSDAVLRIQVKTRQTETHEGCMPECQSSHVPILVPA